MTVRIDGRSLRIDDGATHGRVQDAYALRCMPQVHGASRDAIAYALVREQAAMLRDDRELSGDIGRVAGLLRSGELLAALAAKAGV